MHRPIRTIGPVDVSRSELRRPVARTTKRADWKVGKEWSSTLPTLDQFVVTRRIGTLHGVSFSTQRSLSIDAVAPGMYGWRYVDDADQATPPCAIAGATEWREPVIRVRQGAREVRITALSTRTRGSRAGCILDTASGELPCPVLTRTVISLARPPGARRLTFERLV